MKIQGGLPKSAGTFGLAQAVLLVGLFYFLSLSASASVSIRINEIAWMGTFSSSNDEWMELYNSSNADIVLDGWKIEAEDGIPAIELSGTIPAGGYFLMERTDDDSVEGIRADLIYVGALGNEGEHLVLYDGNGVVVDEVDAGSAWPAGDNISKLTMTRNANGSWSNSQTANGSPGQQNAGMNADDDVTNMEEAEEVDNSTDPGTDISENTEESYGDTSKEEIRYILGDVLINELVSDPCDEENEWVEIYNTTMNMIDLSGWYLEDGSGAKTSLSGEIGNSSDSSFFVVEKPKGNLNNQGDKITLNNKDGRIIDILVYGDWNDGYIADNAPIADDPYSLARKLDGYNTFNNAEDFAVTKEKTRGYGNVIQNPLQSADKNDSQVYIDSQKIIISELMPDPIGSDNEEEYIELHNTGNEYFELIGWKIADLSGKTRVLTDADHVAAYGYLALKRSETNIALNNDKDEICLYAPLSKEPVTCLGYEKTYEGWSYNYDENTKTYAWSEVISPGNENIIQVPNRPPVVAFSYSQKATIGQPVKFDSSDTIDEEGDELKYHWDFGDGADNELACPEHTFFLPGRYVVSLKVSDADNTVAIEKTITVNGDDLFLTTSHTSVETPLTIRINEFLPNPAGSDSEEEFIELYNWGEAGVSLSGLSLDDAEGGSAPYVFEDDVRVESGAYLLVKRKESRIALNNNGDEARILKGKAVIDKVIYGPGEEAWSYALKADGDWAWSKQPTPGNMNIFDQNENDINGIELENNILVNIALDEIEEYGVGDRLMINGFVTVVPGILGSQIFYIGDGANGLQVYSYNKDFPELSIGDEVSVSGEISSAYGEKRIKTKEADDISVISSGNTVTPAIVACGEISERNIGCLVNLQGKISDRKGDYAYLDDGSGEVRVYLKNSPEIKGELLSGTKATVTGILSNSSSGMRLLPRSENDIVLETATDTEGRIMGVSDDKVSWMLGVRDKRLEYFRYLLIIVAASVISISLYLIKYLRQTNE